MSAYQQLVTAVERSAGENTLQNVLINKKSDPKAALSRFSA